MFRLIFLWEYRPRYWGRRAQLVYTSTGYWRVYILPPVYVKHPRVSYQIFFDIVHADEFARLWVRSGPH